MDTSEVPVNSIGRTIWTVWGYLTGAVARYLRPEVTNEGNQNVYSEPDDTVLRSTTKQLDGQVKEIAEKEQGVKNYNGNENNTGAVKCLLPEAIVVNEDNNTLDFDSRITQCYNAAMWCPDTDHMQKGEIIIPDVQENIENEQKQTKCDAHMEKEASVGSLAPYACNKKTGIKTEQESKETEDIEQKDGHNEDTKEESDHYNEDDRETCVMKTEDLDGTKGTIQSVPYGRDQQQKKLINKMDFIETEHTRTEHPEEKMVQNVTKKKIACKDQERAENDNDEESESLENDEDLLAMWCPDTDHKQKGEIIIPDVQENIENEQKQTQCDAHMEKEAPDGSLAPYACNKKTGIKTEQEPKETEDIEQKDGHNEDTKEESDYHNEDDGETSVMKTEDLDGTEVTIQSVPYGRDQEQINKMDYIETDDTRAEYAQDKMIQNVTKKKIACKVQERAENDKDEESESLENDEDLLAMWCPDTDHKQKGEIIIPDVQENIENEQNQTQCDAHMEKEAPDGSLAPYTCNKKTRIKTEQEPKEAEVIEQKDGHNEDTKEESDHYNEDDGETSVMKTEDLDGTEVTIQSVPYGLDQQQINKMDYIETDDTRAEYAQDKMIQNVTKKKIACKVQERAENDKDEESESLENDEDLLAMWCPDTDHKQKGEIIIPDVQENIENEQKQTQCDAHMEKEASDLSLAPYACNKKTRIKTEQEPKETEDIEQKDGHNEDTKEESDHHNEDDGETSVMKTEDLDGTEVTIQSVPYGRDQQQKKLINMDYIETEDTRTDHAQEKMVQYVRKDQERAENDNDEESESLENDEDLLAELVCSTEDETDLPKPFEIEKLSVKETCLENIKHDGIQTPESQEGIFSKDVVQMSETKGTNEQDKQGHEQHKWQDNCELVDIFSTKEASENKLEMVETLPRLSKQTFEENVIFNELGPETTTDVKEGVNKTFDASEDSMQSDSLEFTLNASLNSMLVEATEIEQDLNTPISSLELGTKQIQTLKEMAKFTLKECAELKTELLVETMKRQIDSEEKAEDFMTANQADNEIFDELSTTVDTIGESLIKGKGDSSVEINGKERNAEDTPDVTEEKTELIMVLEDNSERHTEKLENMEAEVGLLGEADALETVESLDEMMNQILKETIDMENKFVREQEPSSETSCNVEFQRPTSSGLLLEDERGLLGETVENLVEMVEAGIYEAVNNQKDQHNVTSPECEPTDADRGFQQLENNTVGETLFRSNDGMSEINRPGLKRRFDDMSKDLPKVKDQKSPLVESSPTADLNVQQSSLDFSVQKSRIAVKNPLVRPPKDPRKLLNKTSMEPSLPKPPPCGMLKGRHGVAVSVQSKGVIGFKLPGMVAELHTLRKTEFGSKVREEEKAESTQQKEKSVAETEKSVKQEQASLKPKWTPPKHPGMGSPLMMAELKSKLKMPPKK